MAYFCAISCGLVIAGWVVWWVFIAVSTVGSGWFVGCISWFVFVLQVLLGIAVVG